MGAASRAAPPRYRDRCYGCPMNQPKAGPLHRVPWRGIVVFYVLACALAWVAVLPLWLSGHGLHTPGATGFMVVMMFAPGVSAFLVTRLLQKQRLRDAVRGLGLWPIRPIRRTAWFSVVGIFGAMLVVVVGVFLAAELRLIRLDLVGFSGFEKTLPAGSRSPISVPVQALVVVQIFILPLAAVFNALVTIGEEVGWRGWLLPALRPLGDWPALLISGALWGLWHTPVILLGYNFDQPNLFGLVLMTVGCTLFGVLIGWLRLRSGSVWPAALAHGGFNAAAGFSLLVAAADSPHDPVAVSPVGWVTWIVMVTTIVALTLSGQIRAATQGESSAIG